MDFFQLKALLVKTYYFNLNTKWLYFSYVRLKNHKSSIINTQFPIFEDQFVIHCYQCWKHKRHCLEYILSFWNYNKLIGSWDLVPDPYFHPNLSPRLQVLIDTVASEDYYYITIISELFLGYSTIWLMQATSPDMRTNL